jgi:hypothetical protein
MAGAFNADAWATSVLDEQPDAKPFDADAWSDSILEEAPEKSTFNPEAWATSVLDGAPQEAPETPWIVSEQNNFGEELVSIFGTAFEGLANAPAELLADFTPLERENLWNLDIVEDPETMAGKFAAGAIQFIVPFMGAMKAAKGVSWAAKLANSSKKGKVAFNAAVGGATGALVFKADDPNLINALNEVPGLKAVIPDFLATDPDDSAALNRMRTFIADALGGAAVDGVIAGLSKMRASGYLPTEKVTAAAASVIPKFVKTGAKAVQQKVNTAIQNVVDTQAGYASIDEAAHAFNIKKLGKEEADRILEAGDNRLNLYEEARELGISEKHIEDFFEKGAIRFTDDGGLKEFVGNPDKSLNKIVSRVQALSPESHKDFSDLILFTESNNRYAWLDKQAAKLEGEASDIIKKGTNKKGELSDKAKKRASKKMKAAAKKRTQVTGVPRDVADAGLKKFDIETGTIPNRVELDIELKNLKELNQDYLKMMKAFGSLAQKDIDNFNAIGELHAFFYKKHDPTDFIIVKPGAHKTMPGKKQPGIKKSRDTIDEDKFGELDPLEDMLVNMRKGYHSGMRDGLFNRVNQMAFKRVLSMGKDGEDLAIDITGKKAKGISADDKLAYHQQDVYINGEKKTFLVKDRQLMDSLKAQAPVETSRVGNLILSALRPFKTYTTKSITLDPTFIAQANFPRDSVMYMLMSSEEGFVKRIAGLARGVGNTVSNSKTFKGAQEQGMAFSRSMHDPSIRGLGTPYRNIMNSITKRLTGKEVKYTPQERLRAAGMGKDADTIFMLDKATPQTIMRRLDGIAAGLEFAPRMAEYNNLIAKGYSPRKASYIVRDFTDFSNTGSAGWFRKVSSVVPFMNTNMQGIYKFFRTLGLKKLQGRTLTKREAAEVNRMYRRTGKMAIGALMLEAYHQTADKWGHPEIKERYNRINSELGYDNTIMVVPDVNGGYSTLAMAQAFEYAIIPNAIQQAVKDYFRPEEQELFWEYLRREGATAMRANDLSMIPPPIRAVVEIGMNETWTGSPVVPAYMEDRKESQYTARTSGMARGLGDATGMSKLKIDHFLKGILPGIVGKIVYSLDELIKPEGGVEKQWGEGYLSRRMGIPDSSNTEYARVIRKIIEDSSDGKGDVAALMNRTDAQSVEILDALIEDAKKLSDQTNLEMYTDLAPMLSSMYKERDRIQLDNDMSAEEKMVELNEITATINDTQKDLMELLMQNNAYFREEEEENNE